MMALLTNEEYTALFLTLHQQESTDVYDALIDEREDANDLPTKLTGLLKVLSPPLRTKVLAVHVGLSQPLVLWNLLTT